MAYCDAAEATVCGVDVPPLPLRLALPALPALPDPLMPWPVDNDNDDDEAISNCDRLRRTLGLSGLEPRPRLLQGWRGVRALRDCCEPLFGCEPLFSCEPDDLIPITLSSHNRSRRGVA